MSLALLIVTLATNSFACTMAFAQSFKPGDRVQALWAGKWESGTVMPLLSNDLDKSGRVMRVKLDSLAEFLQPDGSEVSAKDVRPGGAPAPSAPGATNAGTPGTAQGVPSNGTVSGAIGNSVFRSGDRVSAMWGGKMMTGVVVPMLPNDLDKSGRVLRVKLDDLAEFLQPNGTEISAKDVRHSNAPPPLVSATNTQPGNTQPANTAHTTPYTPPPQTAPVGGNTVKPNTSYKTPLMNGSVPNLTGTAWKMLYDRPVNVVPLIRFTKKGTYDTVRYSLGAGMRGNYRQSGGTVFLNNEAFSMSFNAGTNILLLTSGGTTLKLLYNGITSD